MTLIKLLIWIVIILLFNVTASKTDEMTKKCRLINDKSNSDREQIISTLNEKYRSIYQMRVYFWIPWKPLHFCASKFNKKIPVINTGFLFIRTTKTINKSYKTPNFKLI